MLKLSAFAANEFRAMNYRGRITITWDTVAFLEGLVANNPNSNNNNNDPEQLVFDALWKYTVTNPKRAVASVCPIPNNTIPRRLWQALVLHTATGDGTYITADTKWGTLSKKTVRNLVHTVLSCPVEFTGKHTYKEEFVTAGGIDLAHINMKTMESKVCPGLYFCGEIINVDGITGGYNFMNCWSTGYIAGHSAARRDY